MAQLVISPASRIEGHARITIALDPEGLVADARVEVMELRGFESIAVGRPIREMPALTARICGICPIAHSLAAAAAGEEILGASPPETARLLRQLVLLGSLVQSHATSFFYLSAPDFVFGHAAPDELRNVFALSREAPGLARDGVHIRSFGQQVVETVTGRRVHAAYIVPGGVTHPLDAAARDQLSAAVAPAVDAVQRTLAWWNDLQAHAQRDTAPAAASRPAAFLAQAGRGGALEHAGRELRLISSRGEVIEEALSPADCLERIHEEPVPWSLARRCTWRGIGTYQVGPLARINVATRCGTPGADAALRLLLAAAGGLALAPLHAHGARLVEILFAVERIGELLDDDAIIGTNVLAPAAGRPRAQGVGACEAPRGTLFHRYRVDERGIVTAADIVAPTGQNARAMDAAVCDVARETIHGGRLTPESRSRIAAAVRAFDPCLSCATHSIGGGGIELRVVAPGGEVVDELGGAGGRQGTTPSSS